MKFWIESTKESDEKIIYTMKGSVVIFLLIVGLSLGMTVVLLTPNIFKYVFLDICTF